jgi:hypothetical protein
MHKFQAHAGTDVTGFGLLGHANNLEFFLTHVGKIYMNGSVGSPTVISLSNCMGKTFIMRI